MKQPLTRKQAQDIAEKRVFRTINQLAQDVLEAPAEDRELASKIIARELDQMDTLSDEWYELSEKTTDNTVRAGAFKVAQLVLTRNAYADGLPFCELCGRIGVPEHNGHPVVDGKVCADCNTRKIIPARIRQAQDGMVK